MGQEKSTSQDKGSSDGSSDEAIGRPGEWREGRYQQSGKPVDRAVNDTKESQADSHDTTSTPVTRKDYEGSPKGNPR
jgi:hypothetical protein